MKGLSIAVKPLGNLFLLMLFVALGAGAVLAQVPVDEDGKPIPAYLEDDGLEDGRAEFDGSADERPSDSPLSATELEDLVGPIALYPDDLLAIVLPASTYPLEIVQAARFLERLETDSALEPDEDWDDSIVALLNYPDVVRMMDEDIDWTWRLGEAVISQQNEVIAAVETFRDRAYAAGNLKTDEYQKVSNDEGVIEIVPVNEEIIYVPYYEPAEVVVYQPRPVYYYYPDPYPVYYYPYPTGYRFHSGLFWGVTTAFHIGWSNHYLHVYHPSYWGHPYYGRSYFGHYYRRPSINVYNNWYVNNRYSNSRYRYRDGDYWRPRTRAGSRPDEPRVRNYHYPPNTSDSDRSQRNYRVGADRNRLQVSDNGRMNLNLRERDRGDARVETNGNRQARVTDSNRASNANRGSGRVGNTDAANRTASTNRNQVRTGDDRTRVATGSARANPDGNRQAGSRPDIRFRDRSNDVRADNSRAANTRSTTRPATSNQTGRTGTSNNSGRNTVTSRSNQPRVMASERRSTADRPTVDRSASTRRTSPPTVSRPSTNRVTPTPRATAPAVRQSNPAPRSSAPPAQQRAPSTSQGNSRSSSRGSSDAGKQRRSSTSRTRTRN